MDYDAVCKNCHKPFSAEPGWDEFCCLDCEIAFDDKVFEQLYKVAIID